VIETANAAVLAAPAPAVGAKPTGTTTAAIAFAVPFIDAVNGWPPDEMPVVAATFAWPAGLKRLAAVTAAAVCEIEPAVGLRYAAAVTVAVAAARPCAETL
jgi:hypothetical protein